MKRIVLYGELAHRFGREHRFEVQTAGEAFHALSCAVDGFREYMLDRANSRYQILSGGREIEPDQQTAHGTIRFVPVVSGANGGAAWDAFTGANIVRGIGRGMTPHQIWMSHANQQALGGAMIVGGRMTSLFGGKFAWLGPISETIGVGILNADFQRLAGELSAKKNISQPTKKDANDTPTYAFTGPHLTVGQGNPVPVLYGGPLRVGGAIVSAGRSTEFWTKNGLGGKGDDAHPTTAGAGGDGSATPYVWAVPPVTGV